MPRVPALLLIVSAFLLSMPMAGCSGEKDTGSPGDLEVRDGLGRTVRVPENPGRIVTIAPGATEIVLASGAADRLAGISTADPERPELDAIERISALPLDVEAVVAIHPDLILASDQVNDPAHADMFDALGIPIFYLETDSWDGVLTSILQTGRILDTEETARAAADSLTMRQNDLLDVTSRLTERPTAIFLVSHIRSYSFGKGSFVLDLMKWAGLDPLTEEFDMPAPVLDDEWVLMRNPDIIIGSFGEDVAVDELLAQHPTWQSLDAVRNGRIINVPVPLILTPGPRNVEAAWEMARKAHPDLFRDTDS